jgi:hypothetical protein
LIQCLSNLPATGTFRDDHQQINVAVCLGIMPGNRTKENDFERMN